LPQKTAVIITSIAEPNEVLNVIARQCRERGYHFVLIGDEASPPDFFLEGCDYYSLQRQSHLGFEFADKCPTRHYARKNIGYLIALQQGAEVILETDDDNFPAEDFWRLRLLKQKVKIAENGGWLNTYRYFTDSSIWPRGFLLSRIQQPVPDYDLLGEREVACPIQQNLVTGNPDVDAIYRLTLPISGSFLNDRSVALKHTWCPFNSQNTTWWRQVFALMYLPAFCSFRMTDIWRSFIAQRIIWENDWAVLFDRPTMHQIRNKHDLMADFKEELPGYLHNEQFCNVLESLSIVPGVEHLSGNLCLAYEALIKAGLFPEKEMTLVHAWLGDIERLVT
jgi:hypothetical protein